MSSKPEPLIFAVLESFYVGGDLKDVTGLFGPEQQVIGSMYVRRSVPVVRQLPLPVVFVHGGMHTGATWETTPDGREGWETLFVRAGIETLVIDQPFRGRSPPDLNGLNPTVVGYPPAGPAFTCGSYLPRQFERGGGRFDLSDLSAYLPQLWPDFFVPHAFAAGKPALSDPRALAAMSALVDRIGRCVIVSHSQGGHLGWQTAIARPDKVAAILSIEPGMTEGLDDPEFPQIPVRIMWGDGLTDQPGVLSNRDLAAAQALARSNTAISVDHLPADGIQGNGHMMMMEDNSSELARRAIDWLRSLDIH